MKKIVLFSAFIFCIYCCNLSAQPNNIDFEQGNFANWYYASYSYENCGMSTPNPMINSGFFFSGINTTFDEHGLYNGGTDPSITTFNLQLPCPWGNAISARLGDVMDSCGAAQMTYSFAISPSNYEIEIAYAVVLYDNHPSNHAPKFYYTIKNHLGAILDSVYYDSNTISTDTSFHPANNLLPGLYYKNWYKKCYNLQPYIGLKAIIHLVSSDCDDGNHRGYAYLDFTANSCLGTGSVNENGNLSSSVSVYPNPASNCVNLSFKSLQSDEFEITLCDIQGNTILKDNFASALGQINKTYKTENLPRGIYFVCIKTKQQGVIQKKVIIN